MSVHHMKVAAAVSAVLAFAAAGFAEDAADGANPDTKALLEYVKKLESRVNDLEREREWPLAQVRMQSESALESTIRSVNLSGFLEFQYAYNFRHGGTHTAGSFTSFPTTPPTGGEGTSEGKGGRKSLGTTNTGGLGSLGFGSVGRGDTLGYSPLRGPAGDDNGFSFQELQLLVDKPLTTMDSTGFRVRTEYGLVAQNNSRDANFNGGNTGVDVREAYMSWRADSHMGFTNYVDLHLGKMDSPMGLESWDANNPSNYGLVTHSPYKILAVPVTVTGLKAVFPWQECQKTSIYVVNGWDVVRDAGDGKTFILSHEAGKFDWMNSTLTFNASYGNEGSVRGGTTGLGASTIPPDGNKTKLLEVIWRGEMDASTSVALDGIWERREHGVMHAGSPNGRTADIYSLTGYAQHWMTKSSWISGRIGYYVDEVGSATLGQDLRVLDGTVALGWIVAQDLSVTLEYRHDMARSDTEPFFTSSGNGANQQDTITASFLYQF